MKRGFAGLPIGLFALALAIQPSLALRQGTLSPIPASSLLKKPASPAARPAARVKVPAQNARTRTTQSPGKNSSQNSAQNSFQKPAENSGRTAPKKPTTPTSGDQLLQERKLAEAEAAFRQTIAKLGPTRVADNEKLISAYLGLAAIYAPRDTGEALRFYELALDLAETSGISEEMRDRVMRTLPELHSMISSRREVSRVIRGPRLPVTHLNLPDASTLLGTDDATQVEVALRAIWNNVNRNYKKKGAAHVSAALGLVRLYMQQQRFGDAQMLLTQINDIYPKMSATEQSYCAGRLLDMSLDMVNLHRFIQAEELYTPVLKGAKLTNPTLQISEKLTRIVDALIESNQFPQAENVEKALLAKDDSADAEALTAHRLKLAKILRMTRRFGASEELYKMALESEEKFSGKESQKKIAILIQLTSLYILMQRKDALTDSINKLDHAVADFAPCDNQVQTWRELQELAVSLSNYGETEAGVKLLQTVLANSGSRRRFMDHDVQQAVQRTAKAAAQAGDIDSAEHLYRFAIKGAEGDAERSLNEQYSSGLITLLFENKEDKRGSVAAAEYLDRFKAMRAPQIYSARSIAQSLDRFKQHQAALSLWQAIIEKQRQGADQPQELAASINSCARSMVSAGEHADAAVMLKRLIGMVSAKNADLGDKLLSILSEYNSANRSADCNRLGDDIVHSYFLRTSEDSELLARIGSHYQTLGQSELVQPMFEQAFKAAEKAYGNDSHQIRNLRNRYANILRMMNRPNEAAEIEKSYLHSTIIRHPH